MTWADLIVIGAKVATLLEWNEVKEKRNPKGEGGVSVANLFGAEWQIQLGREDAAQPDPEVSIPTTDSSVDEIRVSFSPSFKAPALRHPVLAGSQPLARLLWSRPHGGTYVEILICRPQSTSCRFLDKARISISDEVLVEHFFEECRLPLICPCSQRPDGICVYGHATMARLHLAHGVHQLAVGLAPPGFGLPMLLADLRLSTAPCMQPL